MVPRALRQVASGILLLLLSLSIAYAGGGTIPSLYREDGLFRAVIPTTDPERIMQKPRAAIVPHHLVAARVIGETLSQFDARDVQRIILLSPDHFFACPSAACTTSSAFQTPVGAVPVDQVRYRLLTRSTLVATDDALFIKEHGIHALLPFVKLLFPKAKITPIAVSILDWTSSKTRQADFAKLITSLMTPGTILVVSSDFSHYLTLPEANKQDELTAQALFSGDVPALIQAKDPSMSDCPICLATLTRIAATQHFQNPVLIDHTNSATLGNDPKARMTTSHFGIAYYADAQLAPTDPTFAGDVTFVRGVTPRVPDFWLGTGERIVNLETPLSDTCTPSANPYIFCSLRETFAKYKDLATLWNVRNNHAYDQGAVGYRETLRLLASLGEQSANGATETSHLRLVSGTLVQNPVPDGKIDLPTALIRNLQHTDDTLTLAYLHAGTEYTALPTEKETTLYHSLIDAGADAVFVSHSHITGPTLLYHGKPIFTGLGNFVFDSGNGLMVRLRKEKGGVLFETEPVPSSGHPAP